MDKNYKKLVGTLLEKGLLVAPENEGSFCKERGIELKRMDNGTVFISIKHKVEDFRNTSLNMFFRGGSLQDKPKKDGTAHFLEHLFFSKELTEQFTKDFSSANAWTDARSIHFKYWGTTNSEFPNFSFYATLGLYMDSIKNYPALLDVEYFSKVKNTIHSEIDQDDGDFYSQANDAFMRHVMDPDNFRNKDILGTHESLDGIVVPDIRQYLNENIVNNNLTVSLFANGDSSDYEFTKKKVISELQNFNRTGNTLSQSFFYDTDKLNKNYGKNKKVRLNIKNGLVKYISYFVIPVGYWSKEALMLSTLYDFLRDKLYVLSRSRGLGYRVDITSYSLLSGQIVVSFTTFLNNREYKTEGKVFEALVSEIIRSVVDYQDDLKKFIDTQRVYNKATPLRKSEIIDDAVFGIERFGLLFDTVKYHQIKSDLDINGIIGLYEKFRNIPRNTFIVGDI